MLGKFIECEADRNSKYYRVIQTIKEYRDGRRFPLNEIVVADNKVDLNATDRKQIGGFYISTKEIKHDNIYWKYSIMCIIHNNGLCSIERANKNTI